MNKKSKILLSSIATIAMCASVATGATYALFTSESEVSIAVTSGTVDVRATASELSLYTDGEAQNGAFALGGTATKNGNIIKIERMMPMDSVNFDIVIENYSDVTVQYRTVINSVSDTGLFSALEVTFTEGETEQVFKGGYSYADWATLEPEDTDKDTAEAVKTINVNIEFPDGANQNGYQGKSCEIAVTVEAVQGNADVVNPVTKVADNNYLVNSEEGMMLISGLMKDFAPNEAKMFNLALTADMDMKGYDWASPNFYFTHFNGNGHTISNLNCVSNSSYAGQVGFAGYFGGGSLKNVTFENVTATGNQAGVIAGAFDGCEEISGVVIKGRNTVSYKNVNENEKASGVGAIFGVNGLYKIKTYTQASIVVDSGATIDVYYNDMQTQILDYYDFADKYAFASTNLNEALTDNGTVTAHGVWYQIISDGFMRSSEGEYVITNKAGLFYLAEQVNGGKAYSGETVKLLNNIDLENEAWTPIGHDGDKAGFQGVFNGNNCTISNLYVDLTAMRASQSAGLFGSTRYATLKDFTVVNATIKNLDDAGNTDNGAAVVVGAAQFQSTISNVDVINATVEGNRRVSAIAGYFVGTIENCDVTNVTLTATVDELTDGSYDNGDKVGGIIAYSNGASTIKNNTVTNATIGGYRDVGGIAGYATTSTLTGNKVEGLTLVVNTEHNYKNYGTIDEHDVNAIIGEGTADESNTSVSVSMITLTGDKAKVSVTEENAVVNLPSGEYSMSGSIAAGATIIGSDDTAFVNESGNALSNSLTNVTFENITFDGKNALRNCYANGTVTFTNCEFKGNVYGAHFDGGTGKIVFEGCYFEGWNSFGSSLESVTFINCTFAKGESGYASVRFYQNGTFENCTFEADFNWIDVAKEGVSIELVNCINRTDVTLDKLVCLNGDYTNVTCSIDNVLYDISENEHHSA